MDIAALSTVMAQGKLAQQISVSVSKLSMDNAKQQGQAVSDLIQSAKVMKQTITPHIGTNIDIRL